MTLYFAPARPGLEPARRLRRPVLASAMPRSSAPAPTPRRCCRSTSASIRGSCLVLAGAVRRGWSARSSARSVSATACAARISRWSRWPSPRCSASSPIRCRSPAPGVGLQIPLRQSAANFQFAEQAGLLRRHPRADRARAALAWWIENSRFGAELVGRARERGRRARPRRRRHPHASCWRDRALRRAQRPRRQRSTCSTSSTSIRASPTASRYR